VILRLSQKLYSKIKREGYGRPKEAFLRLSEGSPK
jgi:hypothetical protein